MATQRLRRQCSTLYVIIANSDCAQATAETMELVVDLQGSAMTVQAIGWMQKGAILLYSKWSVCSLSWQVSGSAQLAKLRFELKSRMKPVRWEGPGYNCWAIRGNSVKRKVQVKKKKKGYAGVRQSGSELILFQRMGHNKERDLLLSGFLLTLGTVCSPVLLGPKRG